MLRCGIVSTVSLILLCVTVAGQHDNCTGYIEGIGDGECDEENNNAECTYDGGDCCPYACTDGLNFTCGQNGFDCQYPDFSVPCSPSDSGQWIVVQDSESASALAEALRCSGGTFDVEWWGNVVVTETIHVANGTTLRLTGADSNAGIDGGGGVQPLRVTEARLDVSNVTIHHGKGKLGGGIRAARSSLHLRQSSFNDCIAETHGGAVYAVDSSTISCDGQTIFMDNKAGSNGGAVYIASSSSSIWGSSIFVNNVAGNDGGALYLSDNSNALWLGEASFGNNSAGDDGGAVHLWYYSTAFWNGEASFGSNSAGDDGGAIYLLYHSTASWDGEASFGNNTAGYNGGALHLWYHSNANWKAEASFNNNAAGDGGGASYLLYHSKACWEAKTYFKSNTAGSDGGALYSGEYSNASWDGEASFIHNTAGYSGGALYLLYHSSASWEAEAYFNNNIVGSYGGALHLWYFSTASWDGEVSFNNNTTGSYGGALALWQHSTTSWTQAVFNVNAAGLSGGAVHLWSHSIASWEAGASFVGNTAGYDGGALHVTDTSTVSWEAGASFIGNTAGYDGGALYVTDYSTVSWEARASFIGNTAVVHGGALYVGLTSTASWRAEASFKDNNAGFSGGAVDLWFDSNAYWQGEVSLIGNSALSGGALGLWEKSIASWEAKTFFNNNTAGTRGGALYLWRSITSWETGASFVGNAAGDDGGALLLGIVSTASWDGETSFTNNTAGDDGGALYLSGNSTASLEAKVSFSNNTAGGDGGAIFASEWGRTVLGAGAEFSLNKAFGDGGAVYLHGGSEQSQSTPPLLFLNSSTTFHSNSCEGNGGAMVLAIAAAMIYRAKEITFADNVAGTAGGAVSVAGLSTGTKFTGVTFRSNLAQVGGAVFVTASGTAVAEDEHGGPIQKPTTFERCEFIGNTATATGGAIDSRVGRDAFHDTRFMGNTARAGGALRLAGTASFVNCTFAENTSEDDEGPAVFNVGGISELSTSSFFDNAFKCTPRTFLDFLHTTASNHVLDVVCKGCGIRCQECTTSSEVPRCSDEMEHVKSPGGDTTLDKLLIDRGYWRATGDSRNILACYNADACRGGVTAAPDYCRRGHEGPYCSICSKGFSAGMGYTCTACSDAIAGVVDTVVIGLLVVVVLVVALSCRMPSRMGSTRRRMMDSGRRKLMSFKIVILTWQLLTQFASVARITYPNIYQRFLGFIEVFNLELYWVLQAECVIDVNFHHRLMASTLAPFACLLIIGAAYMIAIYRCRWTDGITSRTDLDRVNQTFFSLVLLLTFVVYSSVSSNLFRMFACDNLDDGKVYLRTDYRIECDSSTHRTFQVYAGCMLLLYTVGIPALYATLLFSYREVLLDVNARGEHPVAQAIFSLWGLYKPRYFYYELVECVRRVLLAGVVVFIYPNTVAQIAIALVMALFFMVLSDFLKPYDSEWDAWVSRLGHAIIFTSVYLALLLKIDVSMERSASQEAFEGILVAAHVVMVLFAVIKAVMFFCRCL